MASASSVAATQSCERQIGQTRGRSAFDWCVYKNRRSALQHLKRQNTLIDTILETEDGSSHEPVHSQVISAFGDKLTQYLQENGIQISSLCKQQQQLAAACPSQAAPGQAIKLVRLAKVNKYTLGVLVECAYSGYIRTDLYSGGIWQVLEVADYYEMNDVIRACCTFLTKNLSRSNCIQFYHIGIKYRHPLQRCAWHFIRANFKHLLVSQSAQLVTIKYEHFEPLLMHDKLNTDNEESVWLAIKLWCNAELPERASKITGLLPCMRFPRFRTGTEFCARNIWRDQLIVNNRQAQQQLAILDRNHRDYLAIQSQFPTSRDGFELPCAPNPRQLRPRVPHSILLAIGGWQQGQPTTLIESYDVNCNLWFECKHRIMSPLAYHGVECINGLVYICGGTDGSEILNEMFTFDPVRGDCLQRPSMRESRCYVSTAHLNAHLYAIGGHNGAQRMKSVERFDLVEQVWQHVSDMNVARSDASACVYESHIFIAGGLNDQVIESSAEFYNCKDNSWTFITSMQTPRTSFTLLNYQNSLLAIGGNNGTVRLSSVEQYNFGTKLWSHHSEMRRGRSTFSAALVDEHKLIVVGGYNGQTPFAQVELLDETTRSWLPLQRIRFDRSGLRVVVVNDLPNACEYTFLGSRLASEAAQKLEYAQSMSTPNRSGSR